MICYKLIRGEFVDGIQLEMGKYTELVENLSQPRWDFQIFNSDETIAEEISLLDL